MGKILEKARMILRNVYVALGATAMPFLIHAMYGMREPDLSNYTVPVQGRVVAEETGEPVAGINVRYEYATANTDVDGRFLIYVPEQDSYSIRFSDSDGFENGGFFSNKDMNITWDEITNPLEVSLYGESPAAVVHGTVLSKETGKPVSGIRVLVYSEAGNRDESTYTPFYSGFEILSDNDGQFYIQVPERDNYIIRFSDGGGLFQLKIMQVTSDEIKHSLEVDLEQKPEENDEEVEPSQ
jgi:hypothetical protein